MLMSSRLWKDGWHREIPRFYGLELRSNVLFRYGNEDGIPHSLDRLTLYMA